MGAETILIPEKKERKKRRGFENRQKETKRRKRGM